MVEQTKRTGGVAKPHPVLSSPQFCGVEQTNYTPLSSSSQNSSSASLVSLGSSISSQDNNLGLAGCRQSVQDSGICSELDKAWLWSALPDDWRSLPSPLDRALNNLVLPGQRFPAQDSLEPGSCLLSNVAKVHGGSVPSLPPLVGLQFFSNDIRLIRASAPARGGGPRGKCEEISSASLKNAKFVIANSEPDLSSLIACTYPGTFPVDGRVVKAHHKALLERIRRRWGGFSYFTAFEYQKRGAPHFHIAISFNLADYGDVVTIKRKAMGRRFPSFQTVLDLNRWLFEAWLDIIAEAGQVSYRKEVLDWSGLSAADIENMRAAFYTHNSAVSWEVMREDYGARHYIIKELSGLKSYQKIVPEWYDNPGRHFLYSRDMRPGEAIQEFVIGDSEVREVLEAIAWAWLPAPGRPLNKTIWNVAASMILELLDRGYRPLSPSVDSQGGVHSPPSLALLRKFDDLRMIEFVGGSDLYSEGTVDSWFSYAAAVVRHWELKKRIIQNRIVWEEIFQNEPPHYVKSSPGPLPVYAKQLPLLDQSASS